MKRTHENRFCAHVLVLRSRQDLAFCVLALASVFAVTAAAQSPDAHAIVSTFVAQTCVECHSNDTIEGGLDLQAVPWTLDTRHVRQQWVQIHDRIASGEMPPDSKSLSEASRQSLLSVLSDALHIADYRDVSDQGRGPVRRLNRREYEQNIRDLLHLPHLDIRDILPEDREAHQSNKSAESLDITRVQLAAYFDAADVSLRQAVASGTQPREPLRYHAFATKMFPKAIDHSGRESSFYAKESKMIPLTTADLARLRKNDTHDKDVEVAIFRSADWPYYGYPHGFVAAEDGEYHVQFFARAVRQLREFRLRPSTNPQPMTFRARQPSAADVSGDVRAVGGQIDVHPEGQVYETSVQLSRGETIEYSLLGLPVPFPITSHGGPLYYDFPPMPLGGHPGIAFRWIEITGPIDSQRWPPKSHHVLFGDLPIRAAEKNSRGLPIDVIPEDPSQDVRRLLRRFAENAARRPVPSSALAVYEKLIQNELSEGAAFADAMLSGYKAFLCSGHFLFLREPKEAADHFAIADRLSHFLWDTRPDEVLHESAQASQLRTSAVLREQTTRLMTDVRFEAFIENFVDYWLDLKELRRDAPDIRLYPEYRGDHYLIDSMELEPRAFLAVLFRENLPVVTLVDADFSMLNDRLARHYHLPPIQGSAARKVMLPPWSPRGGLLTQAAVLKVTANGTTTSPVVRGAWMMDRILGDPPPPPPSGVPAVEPDIRGATTVRELLKQHASSEVCATCHERFDPVGFALESFDILGAWRDRYRSLEKGDEVTGIDMAGHQFSYRVAGAVDSSGHLRDGRTFEDIHEFKKLLASEPRQLAGNLLRRLTVYATGTPMRFSDRREIEGILDQCEADGYRVGDLLHALIQSRIFLGESNAQDDGKG